jgi:hypothetical protein
MRVAEGGEASPASLSVESIVVHSISLQTQCSGLLIGAFNKDSECALILRRGQITR